MSIEKLLGQDAYRAAAEKTTERLKPLKSALLAISKCDHKERLFDGSRICKHCGVVIKEECAAE